ncbi:MAG: response regulator transcription factor, partial [Propionibacteriaceae bacterium]|nr:response regulator transcription factor [Propionibacteriaceae bacterium]
ILLADDYLPKPFSPRELLLRVKSILRRSLDDLTPQSAFEIGDFAVDPEQRRILHRGVELALPVREYDLLAFLLKHPNRVFRRDELLREVWRWNFGDQSTVTVHVRRVRERIEADPSAPAYLVTAWGVGYRFDPAGGGQEA